MISGESASKAVMHFHRLKTVYISVPARNDMTQSNFRSFCNAIPKKCGEYLMCLKHFLIIWKRWEKCLRHFVQELQSRHSWFLSNLKFEIVEQNDRYMRASKSVSVGPGRVTSVLVITVKSQVGEMLPKDEIKAVTQKFKNVEVFTIF